MGHMVINQTYNGGLETEPPAGCRAATPVRGSGPPEAERFFAFAQAEELPICRKNCFWRTKNRQTFGGHGPWICQWEARTAARKKIMPSPPMVGRGTKIFTTKTTKCQLFTVNIHLITSPPNTL